MNGWEQGGGQTGEDHMGCWQCSWWDSGSPAGGYTHGVGMMGYGAGMGGEGGG